MDAGLVEGGGCQVFVGSRPCKTLGFDTPAERMAQLLGLDSNDM